MIDLELIKKYVNGEDLEGIDIEKLENDKQFMMQVFTYTNDKKIYNLCSNEVKSDYEVCKFLLKKFPKDLDFIYEVVSNYLNGINQEDNISIETLNIFLLVVKNTYGIRDMRFLKIHYKINAIFNAYMVGVELSKNSETPEIKRIIGLGFYNVLEEYSGEDIILDFYGRNMIKYIFYDNDIDLEVLLHSKFSSKEELEKYGVNNFMLNFITNYDEYLSLYASNHSNLLDEFKDNIKNVLYRWDWYQKELEEINYTNIIERTHDYLCEYDDDNSFFKNDRTYEKSLFLYYVARKLGIDKEMFYYDEIYQEMYDRIMNELDSDEIISEIENPINNYKIQYIKKIFKEELLNKKLKIYDKDQKITNLSKKKVINLENYKRVDNNEK